MKRSSGRKKGSRAFIGIPVLILVIAAVFFALRSGRGSDLPTDTAGLSEEQSLTAAQSPEASGGGSDMSSAPSGSASVLFASADTDDTAASGDMPAEPPASAASFDLSSIPPYGGDPYVTVNGNVPFFTEDDMTAASFESYGELDALGRCTAAVACVGEDLMPTGERESISEIRPTGWHFAKYAGIDGNYLYNRCHLIAYGLTAENANERNLITGTRYMNTEGMTPFENETIGYIRRTGHHVLYRVTPVFEGDDLVASGVLMEGLSVEDGGLRFCAYAYNVQPGVTIDYATGESTGPLFTGTGTADHSVRQSAGPGTDDVSGGFREPSPETTYVVNTNTGKFHRPDCEHVRDIKERNRWDATGSRDDLVAQGYQPCGSCRP